MASYTSRRGPNMHQYIANLNNLDPQPQEDLALNSEDGLGLFANTDFFDFDMGNDNLNDITALSAVTKPTQAALEQTSPLQSDFLDTDFNFGDLDTFGSVPGATNAFNLPALHGQPANDTTSPASAASPRTTSTPRTGEKRKSGAANLDDTSSRVAAEEDKRRRNTAASARFRVKKKQREQALEKTAREMTEKAAQLEIKVQQLETENRWLKGLITERDLDADLKLTRPGLDQLFEKFKREEQGRDTDAESDASS